MTAAYSYTPLTHGDEIRLLYLESGSGDEIRFSLQSARLDAQPSYEAISYCWGDATDTRDVFCEGKLLRITNSLYTGLKQLRKKDGTRALWADAVCINQADIAEKNTQVQLMSRIYSQPHTILVWLGSDTTGLEGIRECIAGALEVLPPEEFEFERVYPISRRILLEARVRTILAHIHRA